MKDKESNPERRPSLSAVFAVPDDPGATPAAHTAPITATAASPALPPLVTFNQAPSPAALLPFPPPVLVGPPRPRKRSSKPIDDDRRSAMAACMTAYQSDRAPRVSHSPYTLPPARRYRHPLAPPRPADDCDEAALCAYLLAMLAFVKGYCLHYLRTWDPDRPITRPFTAPASSSDASSLAAPPLTAMNRDPAAYQLDYYITKIIEAVPVGTPDYLLCFRGRFIGIEMKNPTTYRRVDHNLSPRQLRAHDHISAAYGRVVTLGTAAQVEDFVLSLYWPL